MNAIDRQAFETKFRSFAQTLDIDGALETVSSDDNLFDAGVLDSFSVAKVIVFVEKLRGEPIDLERASLESFASIDIIYDQFVAV